MSGKVGELMLLIHSEVNSFNSTSDETKNIYVILAGKNDTVTSVGAGESPLNK
jgi:hypothetical protein